MYIWMLAVAAMPVDTEDTDAIRDQIGHVEDLQKILNALERIHPDVVHDVKQEEMESECKKAIADPTVDNLAEVAACIQLAALHGVPSEIDAVLSYLHVRYADEMHSHSDEVWRSLFVAGMLYQSSITERQREIEAQVAVEAALLPVD